MSQNKTIISYEEELRIKEIRKENRKLRLTKEYKEWKEAVFKRDKHTCQKCGSKNNLEAHHIRSISKYPKLIFSIKNGKTLCHNCHKKTRNYGLVGYWRGKRKKIKIDFDNYIPRNHNA